MEHNLEKEYYEQLALNLLESILRIDVSNFDDYEEPDWQNDKDSIGIEITRDDESLKFYKELENVDKVNTVEVEKFNKRYRKNGGTVMTKGEAKSIGIEGGSEFNENYVYIIPSYNNNFDDINNKIKNKIKKLNNNYKLFKQNNLFIFSHIRTKKELFKEELDKIIEIQSENNKFDFIYICLTDCIVTFDLNNKIYNVKEFDKSKFNDIALKAREEVKKRSSKR